MRLYVWRGTVRNFGDELNHLLWPSLLPGLVDDDEPDPGPVGAGPINDRRCDDGAAEDLFLGIGSVLDARHAADRRKIVAGAGFGGYERPATLDGSWEIYWVRGPRTARQLGLPASFSLGDPASLLPLVCPTSRSATGTIGFMPHFESLARGAWPEAAAAAGVTLIDPRGPPREILGQIAGCRVLLSEALHGVIVADAMRIPWVALTPLVATHRAKWLDWGDSLGLTIRFQALPASSPREHVETTFTPRRRITRAGVARAGAWAERFDCRSIHLDHAVAALRQAADAPPQLSHSRTLSDVQDRMLNRLHTLRVAHAASHKCEGKSGLSIATLAAALPPNGGSGSCPGGFRSYECPVLACAAPNPTDMVGNV
jgi:succinoglycan biosynthesis protein ExoV